MLMMHSAWLIILFAAFVKADDDWDDFTNNLATDLVWISRSDIWRSKLIFEYNCRHP